MTGNRQLGIRKNAEKSYGDFSAFLCGREEKVKLYLYYSLSIRKEVGAGMTTFLLPKEALIKSFISHRPAGTAFPVLPGS